MYKNTILIIDLYLLMQSSIDFGRRWVFIYSNNMPLFRIWAKDKGHKECSKASIQRSNILQYKKYKTILVILKKLLCNGFITQWCLNIWCQDLNDWLTLNCTNFAWWTPKETTTWCPIAVAGRLLDRYHRWCHFAWSIYSKVWKFKMISNQIKL